MAKTKILTAAEVFAVNDITTREVAVPEWGGTVLVRALSGKEGDEYQESVMVLKRTGRKGRGPKQMEPRLKGAKVRLVRLSCVNDDGTPMFTKEQEPQLLDKSQVALNRVFDVAAELSGLDEEAMDELLGNSGRPPGKGGGSE